MTERLIGKVVRLVTDDELLINLGSDQGVSKGDIFKILDPKTLNVVEDGTNRPLGSIERVKARVVVTQVNEQMALAQVRGRNLGLSGAARVLSGDLHSSRLTSGTWPEGVQASDPIVAAE